MREVDVIGVRVEMPSNQPIVLLREVSGERYLPIWIGAVEATAIAFAQQGVVPPRPLTHDLMKDVLEATGNELDRGPDHRGQGRRLLRDPGLRLRRRGQRPPSDSIALALRTGTRIVCAEEVLDEAGLAVPGRAGGRGREVPRVPRPGHPRGLRTPPVDGLDLNPQVEVEGCDTPLARR